MLYVETRMSAPLTLSQEAFSKSRRNAEETSNTVQKLATNYNLKTMVGKIRAKKTENETRKARLLTNEQNEKKRREGLTNQARKNEKNARLERVRKGLTSFQSQSGSPPGSARSTTSTTSLFSAPERNAELSSSPLSSARSNKSTSSMSSIFFAPGGKHRTRRHKKHAKRTRKH